MLNTGVSEEKNYPSNIHGGGNKEKLINSLTVTGQEWSPTSSRISLIMLTNHQNKPRGFNRLIDIRMSLYVYRIDVRKTRLYAQRTQVRRDEGVQDKCTSRKRQKKLASFYSPKDEKQKIYVLASIYIFISRAQNGNQKGRAQEYKTICKNITPRSPVLPFIQEYHI